ncbi:MAG: ROK family transcriptional regulator [Verrucomicrobiaceae bacterium]|nr:ROK family transcriptional regulator [Verrucomicrobiaceae bacterium]
MRTFKSTQQDLQARIVREVRSGRGTSRGVLADLLEIAPSTTGIHVDELARRGFLIESGLERGGTGRPKKLLKLVSDAGWFAGVEFTGGRMQAARLDFAGQVEKSIQEPLPTKITAAQMIDRIEAILREVQAGASGPCFGIGVGAPGLVDAAEGMVVYSQFQPDWQQVPLARELQRRLATRVTVENNLHVITMAERWFGEGRDEDDFVVVRARLGFGIGIVKGGKLLPGANHATGEVGMLPWPLEGGRQQVHEAFSARNVWQKLSGKGVAEQPEDLRAALTALADTRGEAWEAVVTDYARLLGITQLILDARRYFLHGSLSALGSRFCDDVMKRSLELVPALSHSPIKLAPTTLGKDAGALGAASLAMEAWNPLEED